MRGPLVHVPNPLRPSPFVDTLASMVGPEYRVLSIGLRNACAYQVQADHITGVLAQFGFAAPVLVGEGLGSAAALLVAAWSPGGVGALILVDAVYQAEGETLAARALRECPPDVTLLRQAIRCRVLETTASADEIKAFLLTLV